MQPSDRTPSTPPPLWEVDKITHKPKSPDAFFNAMSYLEENQSWIKENNKAAKAYFAALEITDVSDAVPTYQRIVSLREKLFPHPSPEKAEENWIILRFGDQAQRYCSQQCQKVQML